jgi:hypothetical protein
LSRHFAEILSPKYPKFLQVVCLADWIVIGKDNSENDDNGMSGNNYFLGKFQEN